ncbi:MAG TPA: ABC transporter permease, partial [Cyclobacteriaceae bacterium]|nr:ABC transporter permease [Cyclobacteriaceae bacterium]
MLLNDIKIAYRNLSRNPGYSIINISGLAVGMAVTMLIGLWVYDEISFNHYHSHYPRIAQVYQHLTQNDEILTAPGAPYPLASELRNSFGGDFKYVVSAWWESNHILSIEDRKTSQNGNFMDPAALEMFSFKMIRGDVNSLNDPASIVLSASAAKALFGDEDPIGKNIRIDQLLDVKITGVYEDLPANSRFHTLHFVGTWQYWMSSNPWMKVDEHNWKSQANVFVELAAHSTFESVSEKIRNIKFNKIPAEEATRRNPQLFLHPMDRWHLFTEWKNGVATGGRAQFVWLFGAIGAFVLVLACINFMNLSTAQSERRAKEVGIRKSIGSLRSQLVRQFLSESFVVVAFAFIVTLALVSAALPWFNLLTGKDLDILWQHPMFWVAALLFIAITSALAGSYPAMYLSSFQPVKVLKGTFKAGKFASVPRKVLVTLQFSVSVALIIGTAIVWQQIQFARDRPIGYTREGLMMIRKTAPEFWNKFDVLRNGLKASGAIVEMAESSSPATEVWFNNSGYHWKGKDPNLEDDFATMGVTHDYGRTMGWQFLKGRDFSRDFSTDSS